MHDLCRTLSYRATFDVVPAEGCGDVLWAIVCSVRSWLARGGGEDGPAAPLAADARAWSSLKRGGTLGGDGVRVSAASAFVSGRGAWACEVRWEARAAGCAPRSWSVEVCFERGEGEGGTLTALSSYADQPGFLGRCAPEPAPSVPVVVRHLLGNRMLRCTAGGLGATLDAVGLGFAEFADFWAFVVDQERSVPVVFVSPVLGDGARARLPVDAKALARALGPCAFVFYTVDAGFVDALGYAADARGMGCSGGAVRVYMPHPRLGDADDVRHHRFLLPGVVREAGTEGVRAMLADALARDERGLGGVLRLRDIREARRVDGLRREAERAVRSGECHALRSALGALREAMRAGAFDGTPSGACGPLGRWPLSAGEVARLFVAAYPDRLDLTARGWRSLGECQTDPAVVWNALRDLCEVAWPLYGTGDVDVERAFCERSTFTLARGMGRMTRRDGRMSRAYDDEYQGRTIRCEAHVGRGNDDADPSSVRVYFCFDRPSGRVVVSHVGAHLPSRLGRGR